MFILCLFSLLASLSTVVILYKALKKQQQENLVLKQYVENRLHNVQTKVTNDLLTERQFTLNVHSKAVTAHQRDFDKLKAYIDDFVTGRI